jgi:hypothetical protein
MIRFANPHDNEKIKELLVHFHKSYQHPLSSDMSKWSMEHIDTVLTQIYAGRGFVLVDEEITGLLVAVKCPCLWIPNVFTLQEAMWHGRNDRVKVELLREYFKIARQWVDDGNVSDFYFSTYGNADFERHQMKRINTTWGVNHG